MNIKVSLATHGSAIKAVEYFGGKVLNLDTESIELEMPSNWTQVENLFHDRYNRLRAIVVDNELCISNRFTAYWQGDDPVTLKINERYVVNGVIKGVLFHKEKVPRSVVIKRINELLPLYEDDYSKCISYWEKPSDRS